jgi:hypothetical protein
VSARRATSFAFVVAILVLGALSLRAPPAFAEPVCQEMPCSVIRVCSSTGMACDPGDRACIELARSKDLEVRCEQACTDAPSRFVYCPVSAGRADSGIVWVLLGVAGLLAIGGGALFWVLLRKKGA